MTNKAILDLINAEIKNMRSDIIIKTHKMPTGIFVSFFADMGEREYADGHKRREYAHITGIKLHRIFSQNVIVNKLRNDKRFYA